MIYKIYEGLSAYLIAPDGTTINRSTSQVVRFNKTSLGITIKLVTDEQFALVKGEKKTVNLARRFTRGQMMKMYEQSKNMFNDIGSEIPYTEKYNIDQDPTEWKERKKPAEPGIVRRLDVVGDNVKSTRTASTDSEHIKNADLAISDIVGFTGEKLTIPEGMVLEESNVISQEAMDELSARKRKPSVKIHKGNDKPKTKGKAVTLPMKIPFFRIDGVDYQSARSASKGTGFAVNTVLKRAKANKDGWFYIENQ